MGLSDDDYPPMTDAEKADARALKAAMKHWSRYGWDTQSIALGWFMARGYERHRARELAELGDPK